MDIARIIERCCHEISLGDCTVRMVSGDATILIEIIAGPLSIPHLIGRDGRMAQALRVIAEAMGARQNMRVYLSVFEK